MPAERTPASALPNSSFWPQGCPAGGCRAGSGPGWQRHGSHEGVHDRSGVLSVTLSWGLVHTVFTLRYARSYYKPPIGGSTSTRTIPHLPGLRLPGLTIGMTFQVSDTNLTPRRSGGSHSPMPCSRTCSARWLSPSSSTWCRASCIDAARSASASRCPFRTVAVGSNPAALLSRW